MSAHDELPRHTTPTWEMELLISGATVFALLQLPGVLDAWFMDQFPRFDRALANVVLLPYLYVKTAVYALILTFVLHLAARGYWVGLVGLRSVYRDGVRWDRLKGGPNYRRMLRDSAPAPDDLIERADNRASLVFGYGVGFALLTLMPLLLLVIVALATWAVHLATRGAWEWQAIWTTLLLLSIVPFLLAMALDRWFGRHLAPEGRVSRFLRRWFTIYGRLGMGMTANYPMLMFVSRAGQHRGAAAMTLALFALLGVSMLQFMSRAGEIDVGDYGDLGLGEPGAARALRNEHYADRRRVDLLDATLPFIPSMVARGRWMTLFIPYRPTRENAALERQCAAQDAPVDTDAHPVAQARAAADAARARVLDCLAAIYAPTLDGKPLADLRFDVADDPASGLRGVVAMIPLEGLAPGRHELAIGRARSSMAEEDEPDPPPHRIAFWR